MDCIDQILVIDGLNARGFMVEFEFFVIFFIFFMLNGVELLIK